MTLIWVPQINETRCTGCEACGTACPSGALGVNRGKALLVSPELCTYCAVCEDVCPVGAIELPYLIVKADYSEAGS